MSSSTLSLNSMLVLVVIVTISPASASVYFDRLFLRNLCGSPEYSISHAGVLSRDIRSVDRRVRFCKALEVCKETEWRKRITAKFCSREHTTQPQPQPQPQPASFKVRFRRESTRKLVLPKSIDSSVNLWKDRIHQNHQDDPSMNSKQVVAATPVAFFFCCAFLCPCFRSRKKHFPEQHDVELINKGSSSSISERVMFSPIRAPPSPSRFILTPKLKRSESVHLNMKQILKATQNFSQSCIIGEGGFGTIYKATFPDGQVLAVKRARKEHFEALKMEFRSEVDLLMNIEHRNLVKLLGYINKRDERILISEYIPNGNLREHLDCLRGKILDFSQRLEIAIDVAHALTNLHMHSDKQVIHRDVKSSNILLTENLRAKVSDFGFARIVTPDESQSQIVTKVRGTAGYIDPEYNKTQKLTFKSDVYSFGVLLIEIFSGRRPVERKNPIDERVTIRWAFNKYTQGRMREILDPLLKEETDGEVLRRMFSLAFECAAPTCADRPSMDIVAESLWAIRKDHGLSSRWRTIKLQHKQNPKGCNESSEKLSQ